MSLTAILRHVPLRLAVEWKSKTVTTDPPRYTPHDEWMVVLTISADARVRVAVFLSHGEETSWA